MPANLPWLEENRRAVEALEALFARRAGGEPIAVREVLRLARDRQVFLIRFRGAKAVLKLYTGPEAAQTVENVRGELGRLAETMSDGPLQAVRCLASDPALGFVILSHAPGRRLSEAIRAADAGKRRRLIRQAGAWLARYTEGRRRRQAFGPGFWLAQCQRADTGHLAPADRALLADLTAALGKRNVAHSGRLVTHAASHGDFAPLNLCFHRGVMTGFDIQGEAWVAQARDAALFLTWVTLHGAPQGPRVYGLARADLEAFLDGGALDPAEIDTAFALFLGSHYLKSFADPARTPDELDRTRQAIAAYLAEPVVP